MSRQTIVRHSFCLAAAVMLSGCAASVAADRADYLGRGRDGGPVGRPVIVTAESRYGSATVSGPVRQAAHNRLEVRLPGGTWVDCHLSCSETLRRETIDFWQNHGSGPNATGQDGPGYFIWRR